MKEEEGKVGMKDGWRRKRWLWERNWRFERESEEDWREGRRNGKGGGKKGVRNEVRKGIREINEIYGEFNEKINGYG